MILTYVGRSGFRTGAARTAAQQPGSRRPLLDLTTSQHMTYFICVGRPPDGNP